MKNILLPVLVLLFLQIKSSAQTQWKTTSPDRSLSIVLSDNGGKLSYKVFLNQDVVIGSSQLGIRTTEEDFTTGLTFVNTVTRKVNQDYELKIGKRKINHVSATETQVVFKNKNNVQIRIDLCAYNDGVAFRYGFLQNGKTITVTADMSQFHVPAGKTWLEPYGKASDYGPAYEEIFENGIATGTKQVKENGGWAFPALFKTAKNWLLITESGLYENFFGSHLTQRAEGNIYQLALPDAGEAKGTGSVTAVAVAPFNTPWRTIIVGKSLGTIVESNLVYHLSESNQIKEDSWIKPGRASWSWWSEHDSSRDLDALKKFVDLSKTMNWEYSLIDANWNIMKNGGHIDELVKYASVQKIDLLLWYNSGGPHNTVTEQPRDILSDPIKRKAEFAKLQKWGVKGIKVDFFQSDKQEVIKLYVAILKDAAAAHLLVNFHGCTLPRGWSRTFPNLMSMEAVRGAENYGWSKEFAEQAPEQNTILTYTRNVVGPMDYTPVTFSSYKCCGHTTSNAQELALSVLFETGLLHFADKPSSYLELGKPIKEFMKQVPVTWDDTRFVQGEPGKETVLARKNGNAWYIAAANGEMLEKTLKLKLPFLTAKGYKAKIYKDGANPAEISYEEANITNGQLPAIKVLPKGGFVIVLSPI